MPAREDRFKDILSALGHAAATLRDAGIPFALAGSLACWAQGAPQTDNDVDLAVLPEDAHAAMEALAARGMRTEEPPEEWLLKAWDGDILIDLIFNLADRPVDEEVMARAKELHVAAVAMKVMALEDVFVTKLTALDEHNINLSPLLQLARALREKVDWQQVRDRTAGSPFADAFFTLVQGLGIVTL